MTDHVYEIIEITGTSTQSMEDAVNKAVVKADASLNNIRWFEVTNIRGDVADGKVNEKSDKVEQVISRLNHTVETRFVKPHFFHESLTFL